MLSELKAASTIVGFDFFVLFTKPCSVEFFQTITTPQMVVRVWTRLLIRCTKLKVIIEWRNRNNTSPGFKPRRRRLRRVLELCWTDELRQHAVCFSIAYVLILSEHNQRRTTESKSYLTRIRTWTTAAFTNLSLTTGRAWLGWCNAWTMLLLLMRCTILRGDYRITKPKQYLTCFRASIGTLLGWRAPSARCLIFYRICTNKWAQPTATYDRTKVIPYEDLDYGDCAHHVPDSEKHEHCWSGQVQKQQKIVCFSWAKKSYRNHLGRREKRPARGEIWWLENGVLLSDSAS